MAADGPYYRDALALAHHEGFAAHAARCAPGILALLEPVRQRNGLVLELGCGSGHLTRQLADAGHRVIATDASPAMLALTRRHVAGAADIRCLALPDDALPDADAVVAVGHVLSYLADEAAIHRALAAAARALRPGGVLAIDLCDLAFGLPTGDVRVWRREGWVLVTEYSRPSHNRFVRDLTVFTRSGDSCWRRDDERHENVLVDTASIPAILARHGVEAEVRSSFGTERLPHGLAVVVGHRPLPR